VSNGRRKSGAEWIEAMFPKPERVTGSKGHPCDLEPHWYPIGLDFISRCIRLGMSPMKFLLYVYMLIRSSPDTRKREKNAHLYGDFIQKGEFFENKISVADFFGKANLKDKDKRNWFLRTVKPLVRFGLVWSRKSGWENVDSTRRTLCTTFVVCQCLEKALQSLMLDGRHFVSH